jgi:uncharacterized membrane protein YfcA
VLGRGSSPFSVKFRRVAPLIMAILLLAFISISVRSWTFAEHTHGLHYILLIVYLAALRGMWREERRGEKRDAHRDLAGKPERKRPLGRPRCR